MNKQRIEALQPLHTILKEKLIDVLEIIERAKDAKPITKNNARREAIGHITELIETLMDAREKLLPDGHVLDDLD